MKREENESNSKRVINYYKLFGKTETVRHFAKEGMKRTSVYRIIKRFDETGEMTFKKIPGRPVSTANEKTVRKVKKIFTRHPSISVRNAASKLSIPKTTVCRIKLKLLGMKAFTKFSAPKYIKDQEKRAKIGCKKVYKKTVRKVLVTDDESYVPIDPNNVPGKKFFHATKREDVEYQHRVKPKAKFCKKYLVWQAIDSDGNVSEPYITKGCINQDIYLSECIKKRLLPFIDKYHRRHNTIFWPDMATSHYARKVTDFLRSEEIEFIEKFDNAPNVPQARGIERFWALCKKAYRENNKEPKNLNGFKRIWGRISKEVAQKSGKSVMDSAYKKLKIIAHKGIEQVDLI